MVNCIPLYAEFGIVMTRARALSSTTNNRVSINYVMFMSPTLEAGMNIDETHEIVVTGCNR